MDVMNGTFNCIIMYNRTEQFSVKILQRENCWDCRGLLGIKIFNGYVGKYPQYVTFICSYCHVKRKLIDTGKLFALENVLLKDSIDHSLFKKDTWESNEKKCGILF